MEKHHSAGSRGLVPASGKRSLTTTGLGMPPVANRLTDVEIPRSAWSNWTPDSGPRQLRRALTADERTALESRRDELAPVLRPYERNEVDRVVLALTDMFGGFPSMRRDDEEAVSRLNAARRVLAEFPAWAIAKGCHNIQSLGVWRDGKFNREWPPSDAEIAHEVRACMRLYSDQHRSAVALLEAEVENEDG